MWSSIYHIHHLHFLARDNEGLYPKRLYRPKGGSDLNGAVGIEFVDCNLWYVWERDGIIQIFIDEEQLEKPLLDISAEVSSAGDLGLRGMALHPHFKTNGFMYLLYTVEPNYLRNEGSEPFIQVEA